MGIQYYIADTETTGLRAGYQEVTEIGVIRATDRVQLYRKIKCEYPERANLDALNITKKTMADLLQGYDKREVVAEVNGFFAKDGLTRAHRCLIGHNVQFDRKFLHAMWESVGEEFPVDMWLDTISLTQEFIKVSDPTTLKITKTATGKISKKLHHALDLVGIPKLADAHNAKVDSQNTYLLWRRLTEEKGIDHLPHHKTLIHALAKDERLDVEDWDD
jgi:DNA polymerase III epsilon subunit-like protein